MASRPGQPKTSSEAGLVLLPPWTPWTLRSNGDAPVATGTLTRASQWTSTSRRTSAATRTLTARRAWPPYPTAKPVRRPGCPHHSGTRPCHPPSEACSRSQGTTKLPSPGSSSSREETPQPAAPEKPDQESLRRHRAWGVDSLDVQTPLVTGRSTQRVRHCRWSTTGRGTEGRSWGSERPSGCRAPSQSGTSLSHAPDRRARPVSCT